MKLICPNCGIFFNNQQFENFIKTWRKKQNLNNILANLCSFDQSSTKFFKRFPRKNPELNVLVSYLLKSSVNLNLIFL